jgi:bifunctional non-homologous end joining protein LigD
LDGEVICINADGVSQFNELMSRKGKPVFYAFDLLWQDGEDLRHLHLVERKQRPRALVASSSCSRLIYVRSMLKGKG